MRAGGENRVTLARPVPSLLARPGQLRLDIFTRDLERTVPEVEPEGSVPKSVLFDDSARVVDQLRQVLLERRIAANPLVRLAKTLPVVQNGLLLWQHVVYQMAWKQAVNPGSRPITVMYGGMGPDLSSVLLTTNAATVYGIDKTYVNFRDLLYYKEHWNEIDKIAGLGEKATSFFEALEYRLHFGYWSAEDIGALTIERFIILELKKLGVDPDTVTIKRGKGAVILEFDWAYPGEAPRRREVIYRRDHLERIAEVDAPSDWPLVDIYYSKSVNIPEREGNFILARILKFLKPGGLALVGPFLYNRGDATRATLLSSLEPIYLDAADDSFIALLLQISIPSMLDDYGWRLYGARKKQ